MGGWFAETAVTQTTTEIACACTGALARRRHTASHAAHELAGRHLSAIEHALAAVGDHVLRAEREILSAGLHALAIDLGMLLHVVAKRGASLALLAADAALLTEVREANL